MRYSVWYVAMLCASFIWFSHVFGNSFFDRSFKVADHGPDLFDISWSPDGRHLSVVGSFQAGYQVNQIVNYDWDGTSLTATDSGFWGGPGSNIRAASWSLDGKYLAFGGKVNSSPEVVVTTVLQGSVLGQGLATLNHGDRVLDLEWSPDGNFLIVGGINKGYQVADVMLYAFDGTSFTITDSRNHGVSAYSVSWSPDRRYLAVGGVNSGEDIIVYGFDGRSLSKIDSASMPSYAVKWSPDGKYLLAGGDNGSEDFVLYGWDGASLSKLVAKDHGGYVFDVDWSPCGRYLAAGGVSTGYELADLMVYCWNGASLTVTYSTELNQGVTCLEWSPFGEYLAVGVDPPTGNLTEVQFFPRSGLLDGISNNLRFTSRVPFYVNGVAVGDVCFDKGINVAAGKEALLDILHPIRGTINLNNTGRLYLTGDLYLGSELSGGIIEGNGNTIFFEHNAMTFSSSVLHIASDTVIDGQGNNFEIGRWSQIFVDTNVTLTLKDLKIKNIKNNKGFPFIRLASHGSKLALDNVIICPADDFHFLEGQLFIHNDVVFTGTHRFVYNSTQPCYITSQATFNFEPCTSFVYESATSAPGNNELILMEDENSNFYFNQCSVQATHTGLRLTKGSLFFDNFVALKNDQKTDLAFFNAPDEKNHGIAYALSWHPDGYHLSVAGNFSTQDIIVYAWDGNSLAPMASVDYGASAEAYAVRWSPDGRYLAVGGYQGSEDLVVYSWDGLSLILLHSWDYGDTIRSIAWNPDGSYLAVAGENDFADVAIYGWNGVDITLTYSLGNGRRSGSVSWSADGKHLAVGKLAGETSDDLLIYEWDGGVLTKKEVQTFNNASTGAFISWSPDARFLAVGVDLAEQVPHHFGVVMYAWNGQDLTLTYSEYNRNRGLCVDWSNDGKYLAVAGDGQPSTAGTEVIVYEWNGLSLVQTLTEDHGVFATAAAWRPDDSALAVCGSNVLIDLAVYKTNYASETFEPPFENGFIFGDSSKGSAYDLDIYVLSGAQVDIQGTVFYDSAA